MGNVRSTTSDPSALEDWPRLSGGARDLLMAVAFHGRNVPVSWIDDVTLRPEDVDELLDRRLIVETDGGFVLGEAVDPSAVHKLSSWSDRRRLHVLLATCCQKPPARLESAGDHFKAAGRTAEAARCYLAAGELACRRHHHRIAMRCLTEGLRLTEPEAEDDVVVCSIRALERCASLASAAEGPVALLQDWRFAPAWKDRPSVQVAVGLALAALLARMGRNVESADERMGVARKLVDLERHQEASEAALAAAEAFTAAACYLKGREAARLAISAAERSLDPAMIARSALLHGLILGTLGETEAGRAEIERCLETALRERLTSIAAQAYRLLGSVAEYASCYVDEAAAFSDALTFCHRHEETITAGMCMGCLSYSYLRSGDWKEGETTARKVLADPTIPDFSLSIAECVIGLLAVHHGELRRAIQYLHRSLERTRGLGLVAMDFFNLFGLALVAEAKGRTEEAAAQYKTLLERWRGTDDRHDAIPALTAAVAFFADQGLPTDAAAAAEALETISSRTANPEATGAALLAAGEMLCLEGKVDEGVASMRRAVAVYDQRSFGLEPIHVRIRLARALAAAGEEEAGRRLLEDCRKRCRKLGARALLARIDSTGMGRPREADRTVPEAESGVWDLLSKRQREVARLLARGCTNKEMATELSVSVRTVEMHVAHILRRLDCRTRSEAAARITSTLA